MGNVVLYMWMSVDGFIAGPGDDAEHGLGVGGEVLHGELATGNGEPRSHRPSDEAAAQVFDESMATGAVITGRRTFEHAGGWGGDHHDGVPVLVLSRTEREPMGHARYVTDPREAVAQAKAAAGDRDVMMHGASAAQALLQAGLLDEMELNVVPVLLGQGRRLFDDLPPDRVELDQVRVLHGDNGVVHLRYRVRSEG